MPQRVLVLGIDAFDPKIFRCLQEQGKLPNFSRLQFSELATTTPPETPVAWSCAATGCNPGSYGIFDFLIRRLPSYQLSLSLVDEKPGLMKTSFESRMRGTPFWRVLTEAKVPVSVIRWPVTFPPEKISGRLLSGLGVVDLGGTMNRYAFYSENAARAKGEGKEKVQILREEGGRYSASVRGPQVRKRGELRSIETPIHFTKGNEAVQIETDKFSAELKVGEWSEIFNVRFKVLPLYEVSGITQAYVVSLDPLEIYLTSVQIDPSEPVYDISAPASYSADLSEDIGSYYTLGMAEDTKAVTEGKLPKAAFHQQVLQIEAQRERMFWREFDRFNEGVLAFVFDAGDRLKHIFWDDSDPSNGVISPEIEAYYSDKDRLLGEVLSRLGDDDRLLVLSDHGFSDFNFQVNVNRFLLEKGHMSFADGEERGGLFQGVEWGATSAYAVGFTSLYLNLSDREKHGVVPVDQREAVLADIIQDLKALEHEGAPVFSSLMKGSEIYSGEFADEAPDLVLGFAKGFRMSWKSAVGDLESDIIEPNDSAWNGDHLVDASLVPGCLFTNFKHEREHPSLMDIAPTVLSLSGVDVPEETEGESLA